MLHVTVVDEKELMGTFLTRRLRFSHKACYLTHRSVYIDRNQVFVHSFAKDIRDALFQSCCLEIHHLAVVAMQRKSNVGINQHNAFKGCHNIGKFRSIRFEKLTTGRHIEKQILDQEVTPYRTRAIGLEVRVLEMILEMAYRGSE